jgi:multisubunit Na+/H+ antiporter MnhB subunit
MKRLVHTLAIHLFCIVVFAFFYFNFSDHFENGKENKAPHVNSKLVDFFLFSTTIQAGVGITDMLPLSVYGKIIMIIQQLIMISINVVTIYVYTKT